MRKSAPPFKTVRAVMSDTVRCRNLLVYNTIEASVKLGATPALSAMFRVKYVSFMRQCSAREDVLSGYSLKGASFLASS